MPRNVAWRRTYSDVACASQMFAANATIYILRQTGPTGFLLKEENESKNYKVFLGDPHSCTCPAFRKEKDLCKHICWVLLKKFRISRDDPLSWQLGLSDLELDEVMRGPAIARRVQQQQQQRQREQAAGASRQVVDASGGRPIVAQREIAADDVCSICQDEFMNKKLPVTFCKFGCGNNVHIKCMKVWAEHQLKTSQDSVIKCPMCREDFGPITLLKQEMRNADAVTSTPQSAPSNPTRMDRHVGLGCSNCRMAPIEGKCYRCCIEFANGVFGVCRCCTCADFYLCQACFNTPAHTHHMFQFRHKRNQRWRNAQRMLGAALPDAMINDLMNRELSATDYETLLQLDSSQSSSAAAPLSDLTEEAVQMLPLEKVREGGSLLAPGAQCRVCLRGFTAGQYVRKLPCQHKFHKHCIDGWLLHSRPTCPIDSTPVFTTRPRSDTANRQVNRAGNSASSHHGSGDSAGSLPRSLHNSSDNDYVRALSVPSLGVTAMRVGGADDSSRREGGGGSLARRPQRDPHIPHRPPARLELMGTRVGAEESGNVRAAESDMLVPGGRLLQEALERRSQLNQHLTQLMMENNLMPSAAGSHTAPVSPSDGREWQGQPGDVPPSSGPVDSGRSPNVQFPFGQGGTGSSPSSLPDRTRQRRQPASLRAKGMLRQRSGSHGRIAPSAMQDLYLGNDPRVNPPPMGEVMAAQLSAGRGGRLHGGTHRTEPLTRKPLRGRGINHANIVLEGSRALDNLTLRDLL
ncbi:hypothetical protein ACOMHN_063034 [Nucella lapillus]